MADSKEWDITRCGARNINRIIDTAPAEMIDGLIEYLSTDGLAWRYPCGLSMLFRNPNLNAAHAQKIVAKIPGILEHYKSDGQYGDNSIWTMYVILEGAYRFGVVYRFTASDLECMSWVVCRGTTNDLIHMSRSEHWTAIGDARPWIPGRYGPSTDSLLCMMTIRNVGREWCIGVDRILRQILDEHRSQLGPQYSADMPWQDTRNLLNRI